MFGLNALLTARQLSVDLAKNNETVMELYKALLSEMAKNILEFSYSSRLYERRIALDKIQHNAYRINSMLNEEYVRDAIDLQLNGEPTGFQRAQ